MLKTTIQVKLQNRLVLTVSLKQQLALLVLPKLELQETIRQELEENPFLEEIQVLEPEYEPIKDLSKYYDEDEERRLSNRLVHKPDLLELLEFQIELEFEGEKKEIAKEIAGNLNEKGLLDIPVEEIASKLNLPVSLVEETRQEFMKLEPTGIGATDIKESLWAQYSETFGNDQLAKEIIYQHFEEIPYPEKLKQKYPEDQIDYILSNIKTLKPYPTYSFSEEITTYIEPDIYVYDNGDSFEIQINEKGIPKLKLTTDYKKLISDKTLPEETRKFLDEKLQRAVGIIKGIEQRRENLKKIAEFLVNYQADFVRKGKEYLKPLILKDVANEVGLHESTVSRIVSGKYAQLPSGIVPLKAFFSTKLSSSNGDVSAEKVKYLIAELIEKEDKRKPLSDQKIANILKSQGINVARRTVTKYREQLNIPDSRTRRIGR